MSTLVLWALAVLVIMLAKWSGHRRRGPRISRRKAAGDFWLWEHESTREVSHE